MNSDRRRSLLWPGRRGILLGLLAGSLALLVVSSGSLLFSYRVTAAQRALQARDWDAAIVALQRSRDRGEKSARWQYLMARALRRSGKPSEAEQHLARAEELGWNPDDLRRQRLLAQAQCGQIKEVEGQLVPLLQGELDDEEAEEIYEAMARGYLASFHIADALKCLNFWVEWQPNNPLAHLWTADLYQRVEKREAALVEYQKVFALAPHNSEAAKKLALLQLELSQLEPAAAQFQSCLDKNSNDADALLGLAECKYRQGAGDSAESLLYDALLLDLPRDQEALALARLGQLALEEQDLRRAIDLLEKSVALDPIESKSHLNLAAALSAAGNVQEAQVHHDAARELNEQHMRLVSVTRRVVTEPDNADLRCEAGLILQKQGLWSAGAAWLSGAIQIDPQHRDAHRGLADYYARMNQPEQARRHRSIADRPLAPAPPSVPGKQD